jgi:hypothetical protein
MPAGNYDITCDQGATFSRVITWRNSNNTPIDLTNYTARMQVRANYPSTTVVLSLTTENAGIALGGALGTITLAATATATAAITADQYVYDLEMITGSQVTRLVEGTFTVTPEVTR